ncbi:MAG: AAA family ATPase [Gammaproteobacteria bacterium]|nr:AAA family ATPase [Gammaproteobacteria bacterium]
MSAEKPQDQMHPLGVKVDLLHAFRHEPPPLDFVLPGLLAGTTGVIGGGGSAGKTLLTMQVAASIAGAGDMLDLGIHKSGKVLFISREDPLDVLNHRAHRIAEFFEAGSDEEVASNFQLRSGLGLEFDITKKSFQDFILKEVESIGGDVRLIVLDTLRRSHGAEENSNSEMAKVLFGFEKIAVKTGAATVFTHHVNKVAGKAGETDQTALRGAAVIGDNIRWGIILTKISKEDALNHEDPDNPGLTIDEADTAGRYARLNLGAKSNYAPVGSDRWLRRMAYGVLVPTSLKKIEKEPKGPKGGGAPKDHKNKYAEAAQSSPRRPRRGLGNIMGPGADEYDGKFDIKPHGTTGGEGGGVADVEW